MVAEQFLVRGKETQDTTEEDGDCSFSATKELSFACGEGGDANPLRCEASVTEAGGDCAHAWPLAQCNVSCVLGALRDLLLSL